MLIIKNVRILDPASATDMTGDISIENGKIKTIGSVKAGKEDQILDGSGLIAAPGLVDTHVHFRDPGLTYKEDIYTGAHAAAAEDIQKESSHRFRTHGTVRKRTGFVE